MSRLIDEIIAQGIDGSEYVPKTTWAQLPVFDITTVVPLAQQPDSDTLTWPPDVPLRPPYANLWLEFRGFRGIACGFLVTHYRPGTERHAYLLQRQREEVADLPWEALAAREIVSLDGLMQRHREQPVYAGWVLLGLDEGACQWVPPPLPRDRPPFWVRPSNWAVHQWDAERGTNVLGAQVLPALWALALLNCRNVVAEPVTPPPKVQAKRQKQGKLPLVSYHVLKLTVPSLHKAGAPAGPPTGQHKRIHICRGHFSTYTAQKPLFGRVTGTFWIPAHVRGQNREGVVLKDYAVTTPQAP